MTRQRTDGRQAPTARVLIQYSRQDEYVVTCAPDYRIIRVLGPNPRLAAAEIAKVNGYRRVGSWRVAGIGVWQADLEK